MKLLPGHLSELLIAAEITGYSVAGSTVATVAGYSVATVAGYCVATVAGYSVATVVLRVQCCYSCVKGTVLLQLR